MSIPNNEKCQDWCGELTLLRLGYSVFPDEYICKPHVDLESCYHRQLVQRPAWIMFAIKVLIVQVTCVINWQVCCVLIYWYCSIYFIYSFTMNVCEWSGQISGFMWVLVSLKCYTTVSKFEQYSVGNLTLI